MALKLLKLLPLLLISAFLFVSCGDDDDMTTEAPPVDERIIWDGPSLSFEKEDGADFTMTANQDRITDQVIITRGNEGGQIFNIAVETESDEDDSPVGTLWALGAIANANTLAFDTFRNTIEPQDVVGENLVMLLVEENIAIEVMFTSWTMGRTNGGGFAYTRSTQP